MRTLAAIVLAVAATVAVTQAAQPQAPTIPPCPEDAVLVGQGDFDHGHWDALVCGPALDDLTD